MAEFPQYDAIYTVRSNRKGTGVELSYVSELVRCHQCNYWDRETVRWNGACNEAICCMAPELGIDREVWTNAVFYCGYGERRMEVQE